MDNIEKLISDADPAKRKDIGAPGGLQLQDPVPVFSQIPRPERASHPSKGWTIFTAGAAVAAVTTGILVWSSWNGQPNSGPAAPSIVQSQEPNTDPSQSASIDDLMLPNIDHGLPNFLVPAHQSLYFQDSAACNALDVSTIVVRNPEGTLGTLSGGPTAHPVIGCNNGVATFMTSDIASDRSAAPGTLPEEIMVARWKDGAWSIEVPAVPGAEPEMFTWPQLRTMGTPDTAAQRMEGQLRAMGIKNADAAALLGPDVPSWMANKASTEFHEYGNQLLSVTYPYWEMHESMTDENGNAITDEKGIGPDQAARYDLQFYDGRGKQVFNLTKVKKGSVFEPTSCSAGEGTYRLFGESPSGVVVDSGPMKLALMTRSTSSGDEYSRVGLFPGDLPATGSACDVRLGVDRKEHTLFASEWMSPSGFKNQAERDAYLKSPEYADAKKVASLLTFDHIEQ